MSNQRLVSLDDLVIGTTAFMQGISFDEADILIQSSQKTAKALSL
jgi:hypothetical protein